MNDYQRQGSRLEEVWSEVSTSSKVNDSKASDSKVNEGL